MNLRDCHLLTDENIAVDVLEFLRKEGFDVLDVKEAGLIGTNEGDLVVSLVAALHRDVGIQPPFITVAQRAGDQIRIKLSQ